jgi:hypothetical protein
MEDPCDMGMRNQVSIASGREIVGDFRSAKRGKSKLNVSLHGHTRDCSLGYHASASPGSWMRARASLTGGYN